MFGNTNIIFECSCYFRINAHVGSIVKHSKHRIRWLNQSTPLSQYLFSMHWITLPCMTDSLSKDKDKVVGINWSVNITYYCKLLRR